jgi:hypothetical protein
MKENVLLIAAGGGGDALMALILADTMPEANVFFSTVIWERKIFDPSPGPRSHRDFEGLERFGRNNFIIRENSKLKNGAVTFIPRLCKDFNQKFFLIDLSDGAVGVNLQIVELVDLLRINKIVIADAGGDILAKGNEPGLLSPFADSMILAACKKMSVPVVVMVSGLGLDGELNTKELTEIIKKAKYAGGLLEEKILTLKNIEKYLPVFRWFPSEVTGLTCLAAAGFRGPAEIRDEGIEVEINDGSHVLYTFKYENIFNTNIIAQKLADTNSIEEAEQIIIDSTGKSEIESEKNYSENHLMEFDYSFESLEKALLEYSKMSYSKGIMYLSLRRVGVILETPNKIFECFKTDLEKNYPANYHPPVWICTP